MEALCTMNIALLTKEEKRLSVESRAFFRNIQAKPYFDKAVQVIQPICDGFF